MALSWTEAQTKVLAAGSGTPFELMEAEIRGVKMDIFKNCPPNLALVLQNARNFGDATFRDGVRSGEATVRELAAYLLDSGFAGVPATSMVAFTCDAFPYTSSSSAI